MQSDDNACLSARGGRTVPNIDFDFIDGQQVPHRKISGHEILHSHNGTVQVQPDAELQLEGDLNGTLHLHNGAKADIFGRQNGAVHVSAGAVARVHGQLNGSVAVAPGGLVEVLRGGKLSGSIHNEGLVRNAGVRGGVVSGFGALEDLEGSSVKRPRVVSGVHYFD